jgi:hypothetical protein
MGGLLAFSSRGPEPRATSWQHGRQVVDLLLDRAFVLAAIDVKKLVRIQGGAGHRVHGNRRRSPRGGGWEYVHVCVDDATRLAYVEVLGDEKRDELGTMMRIVT